MRKPVKYLSATIAASGSLSGEVVLAGYRVVGLVMPAAWTAASITFEAATASGGTFNDVHDQGGTELTFTVAASQHIVLDADALENFAGIDVLKVRSGTSGTPVNQAAERVVTLVLRAE